MQIAVVGAGLSGLTAAYYLHRNLPQANLHLFEGGDRVGGVITTERRAGWLIEHGADCFSVTPPDALQLCKDLGLAEQLIEPEPQGRRAMISRGSRLLNVPEGFVLMRPTRLWQVLKSPLLSWAGKARLVAEKWVKPSTSNEDESLAHFVRRRLGNEAHDRLVQPLVAGIYTADSEKLSMQATMPQFVAMERKYGSLIGAALKDTDGNTQSLERESSGARYGQFRVFPEGMSRLFDALLASLPQHSLHLQSPVTGIAPSSLGGWDLSLQSHSSPARVERFDGVLLALPGPKLSTMLQPIARVAAEELAKIEYASSAIVLIGIPTQQIAKLPKAFGFVVPAEDKRRILAASFASHKFPGRAPDGHVLIRVFIGGAIAPEMLLHDDNELVQIALQEMAELIGLRGEPTFTAVQRWNQAMPQYHVGHLQRVERIEQALATLSGLEVAGNALHGVGIAPVVGAARRAAERLALSLRHQTK
jgi:oxygen-dependent protoporphyrinogen oxidase